MYEQRPMRHWNYHNALAAMKKGLCQMTGTFNFNNINNCIKKRKTALDLKKAAL